MDEVLFITYKDKVYTLKELIEDTNRFSSSLTLFKPKNYSQFMFVHDAGYLIANEKFGQLSGLLASARFALIESHKKLHKNPVEWRSGYLGQLWLRSNYLKNAVVWYNSCLDYIYQIIWFAFDFYQSIETKADYEKELRRCGWKAISDIHTKNSDNNLQILYKELDKLKNDPNMIQLNRWANSLKHHGNLSFKELKAEKNYTISFSGGLRDEDITGELVDIDNACMVIQQVHFGLSDLINFLIDFIDFDGLFEKDENGNFKIDARARIEYKKIVL